MGQLKERIIGGSAQGHVHEWFGSGRGHRVGRLKERIKGGSPQGLFWIASQFPICQKWTMCAMHICILPAAKDGILAY